MKPRARALGLNLPGVTGALNAITDVPNLSVGFSTVNSSDSDSGPKVQTGVTAIHPRAVADAPAYVWAGQHTLNGNGEMTGCQWIHDAGYFMGPICITNTHSVGMAHHATLKWMIAQYPEFFAAEHRFVMPVIAETYDGILNDINGLHVQEEHVLEALTSASVGPVAEGNVGGGNGMISYEFKAGTGTSSRLVEIDNQPYTVGVLVQANFGKREDLSILGVPVGQHLTANTIAEQVAQVEQGSIIVIIATDAPLLPSQLTRLAKRASLGIARTGTIGGHGSGDIFLALSTANAWQPGKQAPAHMQLTAVNDQQLDTLYRAARDGVEEAIINSMLAGETSVSHRPEGVVVEAIDHEALMAVMRRYQPTAKGVAAQ